MRSTTKTIASAFAMLLATGAHADSTFTLPSGVRVEIKEAIFQKKQFNVVGCREDGGPCLINGKLVFGTSFGIPKTYLKAITVTYQGRSYSLDTTGMFDAWGGRPLTVKGAIRYFGGKCTNAQNCEFRGLFSDGVGTFVAQWEIVYGVSVRTVLTDSDDIVALFMHNIDPPDDE